MVGETKEFPMLRIDPYVEESILQIKWCEPSFWCIEREREPCLLSEVVFPAMFVQQIQMGRRESSFFGTRKIKPLLAPYCPLLEKGDFIFQNMSRSLRVKRDKSVETLGFLGKLKSSEALHYSTNHPHSQDIPQKPEYSWCSWFIHLWYNGTLCGQLVLGDVGLLRDVLSF